MKCLLAAFVVPALFLAGCSDDQGASGRAGDPASAASSSDSPTESTTEIPTEPTDDSGMAQSDDDCEALLDADEVRAIATPDEVRLLTVAGSPTCVARLSGDLSQLNVSITPADVWARTVKVAIRQVIDQGLLDDAENQAKLQEGLDLLESGDGLDPDQACDLFTTMVVDIQGRPEGSNNVVNVVPSPDEPLSINAQACSDGVYTSVSVIAPSPIKNPEALQPKMMAALDHFHEGPLR
ncbi:MULTISPECIES: hypothetical protein [unclassified Nocardioides]|uniref:hypothetical protein n=1 Tax=unclassified Nocardioides TaxID=2615069 RepID=UPI0006F5986E|nr:MULTISPECIES: hypothetical protein [unclassified Nocardioides]KQY56398.1 hypothetical protein ASD30_08615 [Nocardioides sp. Root140]KRF14261.1 hypothetical protein ASH02_07875 [Nocardioides sp. Soil796]